VRAVPLAGAPRPMALGLGTLASARPTRLVSSFQEHCRQAISSTSIPGLCTDDG
jgi:hypothetical protein